MDVITYPRWIRVNPLWGTRVLWDKRGTISKRIVPTWYLYAFMNKLAIRLWMDGLNLNAISMFLSIRFCHTATNASTWQPVPNYQRRYRHVVVIALKHVIGWELSCTCNVASWSQRRRPKHGCHLDRWGSTCHAYGRKFAIKTQC